MKKQKSGFEYLPDHIAVQSMIGNSDIPYLSIEESLSRIAGTTGYVPIAIDPEGSGEIYWADLGDLPFKEWQFLYTVSKVISKKKTQLFKTDIAILKNDLVVNDATPVAGLIFHISRCGSTLIGKCLASCPEYIVINQGGPLQKGFWTWMTNNYSKPLPEDNNCNLMFKNLVSAMTRKRHSSSKQAFVKFISWNTLYIEFICTHFPDTPSIFMYRDPVEVIASVKESMTAALMAKGSVQSEFLCGHTKDEIAFMSDVEYLSLCYANYFQVAISKNDLAFLNYNDLKPDHIEQIFSTGLRLKLNSHQIETMQNQFKTHSKDDNKSTAYKDDIEKKQKSISESDRKIIQKNTSSLLKMADENPENLIGKIKC